MKIFLKLTFTIVLLGLIASCSNNETSELPTKEVAISNTEFIDAQIQAIDEDQIDKKALRKALTSFDQTVITAQKLGLTDQSNISTLYLENTSEAGLTTLSDNEINILASRSNSDVNVPSIPKELINVINQFVETTNASSIDQYIDNLNDFHRFVKNSNINTTAKISFITAVFIFKITAKLIKRYPPKWLKESVDEKWNKQLKCAFSSITAGITGSLNGCLEGAAMIEPIGAIGGAKGKSIGALVGCSIGGLIKGIISIADTAKKCS